jgi:O-antigen/teichoic acid export membrane protein
MIGRFAALRSRHSPTTETVITGGIAQLAILVSGVLAARMLGVEDRGRLALFWVIGLVATQIIMLGLPLAGTYWIARCAENARRFMRAIWVPAVLQAGLVTVVAASAVLLVFDDAGSDVEAAGLITVAALPFIVGQQYALAILLGQHRYRTFNLCRVLPLAAYSLALVGLLLSGHDDLTEIALCWAISAIVASIATVAVTRAGLPSEEGAAEPLPRRRKMLGFGLRGLLGSSSPSDTFQLDQAVVGLMISPAALGLYVVAVAFTNLPRLISQNLGLVASPQVAHERDGEDTWRAVWRFAALSLALCGIVVAALEALTGVLVPLLFGEEFSGAVSLTRILLLAALLAGIRRTLSDAVRGAGHPGAGAVAEATAWVVLLPGLLVFAREGTRAVAVVMVGAALAGLLAMLVTAFRAQKGHGRPAGTAEIREPVLDAPESIALPQR